MGNDNFGTVDHNPPKRDLVYRIPQWAWVLIAAVGVSLFLSAFFGPMAMLVAVPSTAFFTQGIFWGMVYASRWRQKYQDGEWSKMTVMTYSTGIEGKRTPFDVKGYNDMKDKFSREALRNKKAEEAIMAGFQADRLRQKNG